MTVIWAFREAVLPLRAVIADNGIFPALSYFLGAADRQEGNDFFIFPTFAGFAQFFAFHRFSGEPETGKALRLRGKLYDISGTGCA